MSKLLGKQYHGLIQQRADLLKEQGEIFAKAEKENRALTAGEKQRDDAIVAEIEGMADDIARHERRRELERTAPAAAPAHNKLPLGHSWAGGFHHWLKTGDRGGLDASDVIETDQLDSRGQPMEGVTIRAASNATDMNIGTAADGGDLVPTGFYNQIIARRDESRLSAKLPVRKIPGVGTTVDVPYDNEADGEFVVKAEANDADQDAPAVAKASMTLLDYTKYLDASLMLLQDTTTALMEFLADFVGRGAAKTHNNLLLTEVAASGTALKTFASATVIAYEEPEAIVANDDLSAYLDEDDAVAWVMRSSVHWEIKGIVSSNNRMYNVTPAGGGRELLGYPVHYSQKSAATVASAKSVFFGNWRYVGYREDPELTFLRDPYTVALKRQVRLLWNFRTVYKVLQAEAIGYGVHPSA